MPINMAIFKFLSPSDRLKYVRMLRAQLEQRPADQAA